ncbi:hypothetical protein GUITHDRAFT_109177 [Guillardia theta CCMP2712]|uniref:F-box domain-containing protein n=1 Tax=Guillardia theta (strain CCMP2712) TaxID=905079 RepID=L1J887_GUITC|nr:hypothetical protein GUITHDRAFT_109177 [Guillardia theta CCMP2712]EKX44751.1 hypothetical protein GUITHDRAFT_109177 [Guillardia theta CCMP2712]|eukprot:XP_005831731.1 hypothetical protein GUITHDRAFT_109177 [Guillardia theta CCMP2712]
MSSTTVSNMLHDMDDMMIASLLSYLPGSKFLLASKVCKRWHEIIWKHEDNEGLWRIRDLYLRKLVSRSLIHPEWKRRQGAAGASFTFKGASAVVVFGGWTKYNSIENDVTMLVCSEDCKKRLMWIPVKTSNNPLPTYGSTITAFEHPNHEFAFALYGGVYAGGYQGAVSNLHLLLPCEEIDDSCVSGTIQVPSSSSACLTEVPRMRWVKPKQASSFASLGTPRAYHTATYFHNRKTNKRQILVFGGFAEGIPLDNLESAELELSEDEMTASYPHSWNWNEVAALGAPPCARFGHSATLCGPDNSRLIIIGGCTGGHNHKGYGTDGEELRDVFVLDLAGDVPTWSQPQIAGTIPDNCVSRCHSAVSLGHQILCFGGGRSSRLNDKVVALDTLKFTWKQLQVMGEAPCPRQNAIMLPVEGGSEVFLLGGWRKEELGDCHVLRFGGLNDEDYVFSDAKRSSEEDQDWQDDPIESERDLFLKLHPLARHWFIHREEFQHEFVGDDYDDEYMEEDEEDDDEDDDGDEDEEDDDENDDEDEDNGDEDVNDAEAEDDMKAQNSKEEIDITEPMDSQD